MAKGSHMVAPSLGDPTWKMESGKSILQTVNQFSACKMIFTFFIGSLLFCFNRILWDIIIHVVLTTCTKINKIFKNDIFNFNKPKRRIIKPKHFNLYDHKIEYPIWLIDMTLIVRFT
jgi:hypothetical protein